MWSRTSSALPQQQVCGDPVNAQNAGANAASKHKAAGVDAQPLRGSPGAGHQLCCVLARRLMTARTKPGTQSECAASWLDKDGNSCGRGSCFLVRTWRAVPVGRSYRRAPLPTHKSCPIPPTLVAVLLAHVSRRSLPICPCVLSLRCLFPESIVRWTLGSRAFGTLICRWPIPTFEPPSILTCLPLWVRQPTIADFPRSLLQDKQTKATYVVLLRGTLPGFLPNSPRPPFRVKCAIDCEPYGARSFLKLVMGSQHLSSSTLTSRFGSQTSTCTTSDH